MRSIGCSIRHIFPEHQRELKGGRMRAQTTLRLPPELKEALEREAQEQGQSFNAYVLMLIDRGRQDQQK